MYITSLISSLTQYGPLALRLTFASPLYVVMFTCFHDTQPNSPGAKRLPPLFSIRDGVRVVVFGGFVADLIACETNRIRLQHVSWSGCLGIRSPL